MDFRTFWLDSKSKRFYVGEDSPCKATFSRLVYTLPESKALIIIKNQTFNTSIPRYTNQRDIMHSSLLHICSKNASLFPNYFIPKHLNGVLMPRSQGCSQGIIQMCQQMCWTSCGCYQQQGIRQGFSCTTSGRSSKVDEGWRWPPTTRTFFCDPLLLISLGKNGHSWLALLITKHQLMFYVLISPVSLVNALISTNTLQHSDSPCLQRNTLWNVRNKRDPEEHEDPASFIEARSKISYS